MACGLLAATFGATGADEHAVSITTSTPANSNEFLMSFPFSQKLTLTQQ
jgi:hypothetical protein